MFCIIRPFPKKNCSPFDRASIFVIVQIFLHLNGNKKKTCRLLARNVNRRQIEDKNDRDSVILTDTYSRSLHAINQKLVTVSCMATVLITDGSSRHNFSLDKNDHATLYKMDRTASVILHKNCHRRRHGNLSLQKLLW